MPIPRPATLAIVAALGVLTACASAAPASGSAMSMTEHQSIAIAPDAVLTYDSVDDSRCPPGVQCVVAGKVAYSFTLTRGDTREQFTLTPAEPAYTSAALQGRHITLADTPPPPRAQQAPSAVNIKIISP